MDLSFISALLAEGFGIAVGDECSLPQMNWPFQFGFEFIGFNCVASELCRVEELQCGAAYPRDVHLLYG
jgi:hypothetical protein